VIEVLLQAESALSLGLLDRAEALYRQVAANDPRNSIAVVGLARVSLERGSVATALEHARHALAIDPENVAAQRLAQRLEEILRFRDVTSAATEEAGPPVGSPPATTSWRDRLLRRERP
jgi:predicted Zn-dependent protease